MSKPGYEPLKQSEDIISEDAEYRPKSEEIDRCCQHEHRRTSMITYLLGCLLGLSMVLNILPYIRTPLQTSQPRLERINYSGVLHDKESIIPNDSNRTIDDESWTSDRYRVYTGMVAMDDDYVKNYGLPESQRYPWDPDRKSIYYLRGFHSMHCVLVMRDLIMDVRDNRKLTWTIGHLEHCLHSMRDDVECNADDFPQYTGQFHAEKHSKKMHPGLGQTRMCRDWDKLRSFAIENTACFDQAPSKAGKPLIENYKNCPDGSRPWERFQ